MASPNKRKDTPLLLKGRIFLNNVTQAIPTSNRNSIGMSAAFAKYLMLIISLSVIYSQPLLPGRVVARR